MYQNQVQNLEVHLLLYNLTKFLNLSTIDIKS